MTDLERIVWVTVYGAAYATGAIATQCRYMADCAVRELRMTGGVP